MEERIHPWDMHPLAEELAHRTGESMSAAVITAKPGDISQSRLSGALVRHPHFGFVS
jgi:hypothetical protein